MGICSPLPTVYSARREPKRGCQKQRIKRKNNKLPCRLPGAALGQSLTSLRSKTLRGQSPEPLLGSRPNPTHSLAQQSALLLWCPLDHSCPAPPPCCVYSGRTRNRTQSLRPGSSITVNVCLETGSGWRSCRWQPPSPDSAGLETLLLGPMAPGSCVIFPAGPPWWGLGRV